MPRARQADVREPPLLLHLARVVERPAVGEDALLQARDEHHVELEALGGVERDERHRVRVRRVGVLVGDQRGLLQQPVEGVLRAPGRAYRSTTSRSSSRFAQRSSPSCEPSMSIWPIARLLEHQVEQLRQRQHARPVPAAG